MTVLPPEIKFGRVVARWLLAAADTVADPDENPDAVVPTGKVTFTRINSSASLYDSLQNDGTYVGIVTKPVEAVLNGQGELSLAHNPTNGIWMVTGGYKVTFSVDGVTWPDFEIEVTEAHTLLDPLDLIITTPIESTPTQVVVASLETALRAEAAADRAEAGNFSVNAVAASGATLLLPSNYPAHDVTLDQDCTITFEDPAEGHAFILRLSGAFVPTFDADVLWAGGVVPEYDPAGTVYHFATYDGGATWPGSAEVYA